MVDLRALGVGEYHYFWVSHPVTTPGPDEGQSNRRRTAQATRHGRAAGANLVPTTTGAALATTLALPQYAGRFDGIAVRVPIPIGAIADVTFLTSRNTSRYAGVLGVSRDPLVSSDIVGDPRASIVDLELTKGHRRGSGQGSELVRQRVGLRESNDPGGTVADRPQVSGVPEHSAEPFQ